MLHTYKKVEKASVVLNDLIKINNERIVCYQQAIDHAINLDIDFNHLFQEIIAECQRFNQQLINKINALDGNPKDNVSISGLIHRAWLDLKVTFTGNTRNAIINFCEYNEEVAQHAYKAALNVSAEMNNDIYTLIEQQQDTLKRTFASLKKCHEARPYSSPMLAYFN
ncbi:MAG: PA2169 family four-helix-bundle protein [Chitinophagales bacterium]